MYSMKKQKQHNKQLVIISMAIAVLIASLGTVWFVRRGTNGSVTMTPPQSSPYPDDQPINLDPPTEQDLQEAEQQKETIAKEQETATSTNNPAGKVTPVITFAGQYEQNIEAAARVTGVFEDNGTCTFSFTKGTHAVSRESKGFTNVSDTLCTPITIPHGEFPEGGEWNLSVSYLSSSSSGTSSTTNVTVVQ